MTKKNLSTVFIICGLANFVPTHSAYHSASSNDKERFESQEYLSVQDELQNLLRQESQLAKEIKSLEEDNEFYTTEGEKAVVDLGSKDLILHRLKNAPSADKKLMVDVRESIAATIKQAEMELERIDQELTRKKVEMAQIEARINKFKALQQAIK